VNGLGSHFSGCWYDPWWGYVCDYYVPTKTATNFNYGAIPGLRFDVSDKVFLKASAGKRWVDFSNATSIPDFTIYRFDIGFMF